MNGHSQSAAWAHLNPATTRPGPLVGINSFDTPLIPHDTPMTKKRRHRLLPRWSSRHLIGLRHIRELRFASGRSSGQLILDRSFTHLSRLRSRNGRWKLTRSSRLAQPTLTHGIDWVSEGGFRSPFLTPQRRPPTLVQRPSRAHARALVLSRSSRFAQHTLKREG
jgi:hypothetical protein